jgi:hypothetical protein
MNAMTRTATKATNPDALIPAAPLSLPVEVGEAGEPVVDTPRDPDALELPVGRVEPVVDAVEPPAVAEAEPDA